METWIQSVMRATSEAESPRSFVYWSALTAISAVMRKNVYLNKFYYKLYPNVYTLLMTDSGGRKGFPVWLAETLVQKANCTRFISGRNSIQSIITELARAYTLEGGGPPVAGANAFLSSGEFDELLIEDKAALTILTSLYDTHSRELWKNTLKSSGTETLKNVCLTILAASNETLFRKAVPDHAIQGGFLGRMLVIPDDGSGIINPLTRAPKEKFDPESLVPYLQELSKLEGEFHYANEAAILKYEDWYKKHRGRKVKDVTGTYNRLHDQILKVSMLLSLSRGTDLKITEEDLEEAITQCQAFTVKVKTFGEGTGKSQLGTQTKIVLEQIIKSPDYTISREKLLRDHYGDFDAVDLTRILDHLMEAGWIIQDSIEFEAGRKKTIYKATDILINRYTRIAEETKE
jgi:hypothetical protein